MCNISAWQTSLQQVQSEFEVPRGLKLKVHSLQKYWRPGELIVCSRLFWHLIAEIANFSFNLRCMSFGLQFFFSLHYFPIHRITSPLKFSYCSLAILLATFLPFATNKINEIKLLESCGVLVLTFSEIDSLFSYDKLFISKAFIFLNYQKCSSWIDERYRRFPNRKPTKKSGVNTINSSSLSFFHRMCS